MRDKTERASQSASETHDLIIKQIFHNRIQIHFGMGANETAFCYFLHSPIATDRNLLALCVLPHASHMPSS